MSTVQIIEVSKPDGISVKYNKSKWYILKIEFPDGSHLHVRHEILDSPRKRSADQFISAFNTGTKITLGIVWHDHIPSRIMETDKGKIHLYLLDLEEPTLTLSDELALKLITELKKI